jgi:hypothetical protein
LRPLANLVTLCNRVRCAAGRWAGRGHYDRRMQAEPVVEAWVVDPLPVLEPTPVRVQWPSGGLDPFHVGDRRTQWMMFASGFTRAWPVSEGMQPAGDGRRAVDVIPMGYTGLSLLEKLAVVRRGRLIAEWPRGAALPSAKSGRAPVYGVQFQRTADVWLAREPRRLAAVRAGELPEVEAPDVEAPEVEALDGDAPESGAPVVSSAPVLYVAGRFDYASTLDLALALSVVAGDEPLMVVDVRDSWSWH